jgi:hypothetical protein
MFSKIYKPTASEYGTRRLSFTSSSSSSIGTTTLSWVSACSAVVEHSQQEGFTLQSAFASGTSNPQLGGEPGI